MEKISRKSIVETLGFFQDVMLSEAPGFVKRGLPAEKIRQNYLQLEAAQKAIGALTDEEYERLMQRAAKRPPLRPNFIHCLPTVAATVFITLFSLCASAQKGLRSNPVPHDVIRVFVNARCACSATDTLQLGLNSQGNRFPNMYRSYFVNAVYDPGERIPFRVYFAEKPGGQLYWISGGVCRNISTSLPLPEPGFYFVRYFHKAKPALIEIEARASGQLFVRAFGKCELHETAPPQKN